MQTENQKIEVVYRALLSATRELFYTAGAADVYAVCNCSLVGIIKALGNVKTDEAKAAVDLLVKDGAQQLVYQVQVMCADMVNGTKLAA